MSLKQHKPSKLIKGQRLVRFGIKHLISNGRPNFLDAHQTKMRIVIQKIVERTRNLT